jgi:hypothetical protein
MAEKVLLDIAQDFCNFTGIAVETLEPITLQAGRTLYDVDPPWNCDIARISAAWFRGMPLRMFSESQASANLFVPGAIGASITNGYPTAIRLTGTKEFQINNVPLEDSPDSLIIRAILKPAKNSESVPDILLDNYQSTIVEGALGKLLKMPATFRDLNLATFYDNEYRKGRAAARIDAETAFGNISQTATPRRFR